MLVSGGSVRQVWEAFGITENVFYRCRRIVAIRTRSYSSENGNDTDGNDTVAKLAAEVAERCAENVVYNMDYV